MKYSTIEGINKKLSRLVYGTPGCASEGDEKRAFSCYDMAYDMGFRVFDTAYSYGEGETVLGKWIAHRGNREDIVILDKGCNPRATYTTPDIFSADTIRQQLSVSLERLQTDYVDMYILHRDDPSKPVDEIVEILNEFHERGKIGCFGGSNWSMERLKEANNYASSHGLQGFTVCSPNYSYMRLANDPWGGSVTISGNENKDFREWLSKTQIPVFNYSSLARGFLSGRYKSNDTRPIEECLPQAPIMEYYSLDNIERLRRAEIVANEMNLSVSQIGLAWLMKQPMNLFPLVSPSSEKHLKEIVDALDIELTEEQLAFLNVDSQ